MHVKYAVVKHQTMKLAVVPVGDTALNTCLCKAPDKKDE